MLPRPTECFHCGLPVPGPATWEAEILGARRAFCCGGCLAVARAIAGSGLDDYYRLRTEPGVRPAVAPGEGRLFEVPGEGPLFEAGRGDPEFVGRSGRRRETSLWIEGARCAACLWLVERRLATVPGVAHAAAVWPGRTVRVVWNPDGDLGAILAAVREIGYEARPIDPRHRAGLAEEADRRSTPSLVFAGAVGMMVMNLALAAYFLGGPDAAGRLPLWETFGRWGALAASVLLLAYPGREFFVGAARDFRSRRAGMDLPIALGLAAAAVGSAAATIAGRGPVWFDAIAMLVFGVLLARSFETRARLVAAAALDRLAVVRPARAHRIGPGGETDTAAADLVRGDRVRIFPGEIVPADAVLVDGASAFDESVVTGEPGPRPRGAGDGVLAGSINVDQPVVARITRTGADSTLGEIHRLLERGLASRPRSARIADRLAGALAAAVLLIAAGAAAYWAVRDPARSLPAAVSVLVVTCPCALALATPLAFAVTAGRLVEAGVLPANMSAIERLADADTAVFDKTGTLTRPASAIGPVFARGMTAGEAIRTAAALEAGSAHPLARAIRDAAGGDVGPAGDLVHQPGEGVAGSVGGAKWRLGSSAWAPEAAASLAADFAAARGEGRMLALLTDGRRSALLTFSEAFRPGAESLLGDLRREGIHSAVLLSGDAPEPVERAARALGFDQWRARMRPAEKLSWAVERRPSGKLLFVGDGLNDAPALAACGASISFAEAPALSRLASDFLVLGERLDAVGAARRLARRCRRVTVQNLGWALGYNALLVPIAASGRLPPWAAALGMSASSIAVVLNSMRLARRPAAVREVTGDGARGASRLPECA